MEKTKYLDRHLKDNEFDGFLLQDSSSNSNLYYLTEFEAPDKFTYLRTNESSIILVSPLEYSRAKEEAEVDKVVSTAEYKRGDNREDREGQKNILIQFLEDHDIERLAVPENFSLKQAEGLRNEGFEVEPTEDQVMKARKIKSKKEIENLRKVQKKTEEAMIKTKEMIKESEVRNGELYLENQPLTSERIKKRIKLFMMEQNCMVPEETIVSCGKESAKPHSTGSGVLEAEKPIIIDIFPKADSRYFGDMTRTFVKGEFPKGIKEMKEAVLEAQEAAFAELEKGAPIIAEEVHNAVNEVLEDHGYKTLRNDPDTESGFIHSTGHAVGLELHETPRISNNEDELREGMVLTIEPGLYLPNIGGVRLEDMIIIKEDGYENLNSMSNEIS